MVRWLFQIYSKLLIHISDKTLKIPANSSVSVPLVFVYSSLYVRLSDLSVEYCGEPIEWSHVKSAGEVKDKTIKCDFKQGTGVYR